MGSEIAKKLFLHKVQDALLLNAPEGYREQLNNELGDSVKLLTELENTDFVQLFVKDGGELRQFLATAVESVKEDGYLWVSYPKKTSKIKSDLHRDVLQSLLRETGYEGVSLISIDDTWSAMRVKPMRAQ